MIRSRRRAAELADAARAVAAARADAQAARRSLDQLSGALDALGIGVVLVDSDGAGTGVGATRVGNAAARALHGHGRVLVDEAVERRLRLALDGTESGETVTLYGPPRQVVQVNARPLPGGRAVATIEDVSERARVDAVRTDFVANVGHELKTPIGALAVLAEALPDASDDPVLIRRLAGKIEDEAHRASRTIDDLMELSRIELDGAPRRAPVSVTTVVCEAVSRNTVLAEHHRVGLHAECRGLFVLGDHRQLVSAVSNLIENAVKYSEPGGEVQLTVTTAPDPDRPSASAEEVAIAVTDRGVGIPPADIDRIFERFYRVDRARSRQTGGTGLGLSIVRHVVSNHAGRVTVRSHEGEGSTFTLFLPPADAQEMEDG